MTVQYHSVLLAHAHLTIFYIRLVGRGHLQLVEASMSRPHTSELNCGFNAEVKFPLSMQQPGVLACLHE